MHASQLQEKATRIVKIYKNNFIKVMEDKFTVSWKYLEVFLYKKTFRYLCK